jgi:hypothetical protein
LADVPAAHAAHDLLSKAVPKEEQIMSDAVEPFAAIPDQSTPTATGAAGQAAGWRARRRAKLLARLSAVVGQPVSAASAFWVEGSWPFYFVGLALGVGVIGGALGALVGIGVGIGAARLFTRRRAPGVGFQTFLAVTTTSVVVVKSNFWQGRPTGAPLAAWPADTVRATVRRKRVTTAVSLELPDGRHLRLETPLGSRKWSQPVLDLL